jgi:hypothetical protein
MGRDDWRCSVNANRDCSAAIIRGCMRLGHADYAVIEQLAACRSHNPKAVSSILIRRMFGLRLACRIRRGPPAEVRPPASEVAESAARRAGGPGFMGMPRRDRGIAPAMACPTVPLSQRQYPTHLTNIALHNLEAAIAQLGERQTGDLKAPGSIPSLGTCPLSACQRRRERGPRNPFFVAASRRGASRPRACGFRRQRPRASGAPLGACGAPWGPLRPSGSFWDLPTTARLSPAAMLFLNPRGTCPSNGAHGVVVSHPLRMRKVLGSNPNVSTCWKAYGRWRGERIIGLVA